MANVAPPQGLGEFDHIDFESDQGRKIRKMLELRLQQLREQNDVETLTDIQTAAIRGRINEIKTMLRPRAPVVKGVRFDNQQWNQR